MRPLLWKASTGQSSPAAVATECTQEWLIRVQLSRCSTNTCSSTSLSSKSRALRKELSEGTGTCVEPLKVSARSSTVGKRLRGGNRNAQCHPKMSSQNTASRAEPPKPSSGCKSMRKIFGLLILGFSSSIKQLHQTHWAQNNLVYTEACSNLIEAVVGSEHESLSIKPSHE